MGILPQGAGTVGGQQNSFLNPLPLAVSKDGKSVSPFPASLAAVRGDEIRSGRHIWRSLVGGGFGFLRNMFF